MRVSQKDVDEILVKYPDLNGIMATSAVTAWDFQRQLKDGRFLLFP